jgi:glucose/arabinose dehydrogenase
MSARAGTAVARGRLGEAALEQPEVIWRQEPKVQTDAHYGSRLVFTRDGHLFITLGDRHQQRAVQDLATTIGKVVRIRADGSVPPDNPFVGRRGAKPEIWSLGHRNAQGAALHPQTGDLWTAEHGARGGDEINIPRAGRNYGWPVITYGRDYSGARIGEGTAKPGMEQPVFYWDPSIAPSGLMFYTGELFPRWKGSAFVGALAGALLARLELQEERVAREERLLEALGERIRDVRQGPDGAIYLLTDATNGRILRLEPL